MSAFASCPSSYNQIENKTILKETERNLTKWKMWYKTLADFIFEANVAKAYATILVNNASSFSVIHNLNNDILKSMGIDDAGHRMQILHMKPSQLYTKTTTATQSSLPTSTRSATTIQHCSQHLDTTAIDKCHRCKGLVCFDCREKLTLGPSIITYCEKCADSILCTIQ